MRHPFPIEAALPSRPLVPLAELTTDGTAPTNYVATQLDTKHTSYLGTYSRTTTLTSSLYLCPTLRN